MNQENNRYTLHINGFLRFSSDNENYICNHFEAYKAWAEGKGEAPHLNFGAVEYLVIKKNNTAIGVYAKDK